MKKLHFLDKLIFFINSIFALLLLASYILPHIDPTEQSYLAVLTLGYPFVLVSNIVFVIIWIIKLKPHFLLSLISILIGLKHLQDFYSIEKREVIKESDIKVMSFNVRRFTENSKKTSAEIAQNTSSFINKHKPDILCIQEYTNTKNLNIDVTKVYQYQKRNSSLAIYSKYKVINKGSFNFKNTSNNIIYVDLKINKEVVRIYNVHLQSFGLDLKKSYDRKSLYKKFETVFKQQANQIKELKKNIAECTYKTIVMGDFNNTAFSWVYKEITEGRKDAYTEAGTGFGKSFHYFLPFRIDFILPDKNMEVGAFTTYDVNLSDHNPIMARINLNN